MADATLSTDSDEECEILVGLVHDRLPREYAHQPTRSAEVEDTDEDSWKSASEEESAGEVGDSGAQENRLTAEVSAWCNCDLCDSRTLRDERETICCSEVPNCVKMTANGELILLSVYRALVSHFPHITRISSIVSTFSASRVVCLH